MPTKLLFPIFLLGFLSFSFYQNKNRTICFLPPPSHISWRAQKSSNTTKLIVAPLFCINLAQKWQMATTVATVL